MRARDPGHLVDLAYLAGFQGGFCGRRIAVASISGAMGGLLTDLLITGGLEVPVLPDSLQRRLRETAPELAMVANPIDLTGNLYNREVSRPRSLMCWRKASTLIPCWSMAPVICSTGSPMN